MHRFIYLVSIILFSTGASFAKEKPFVLSIHANSPLERKLEKIIRGTEGNYNDTLSMRLALESLIGDIRGEGFLLAGIDSLRHVDNKNWVAFIGIGKAFEGIQIHADQIDEFSLRKTSDGDKVLRHKVLSPKQYERLIREIIENAQNVGYPFAQVYLDSCEELDNTIKGNLALNLGTHVVFDSLEIEGRIRLKHKFFANSLNIKKGIPFSYAKLETGSKHIAQTQYMREEKPFTLFFVRDRAIVVYHLRSLKSNQFDGIVGLAPDPNRDGETNITGQLDLTLHNPLGTGKSFIVHWESLRPESQLLDAEYWHPELFGTGIEVRLAINFLKQDTLFQNLRRRVSLGYNTIEQGKFFVFTEWFSTSVLGSPSIAEAQGIVGTDLVSYGIAYENVKVDDIFFPRRGFEIKGEISFGNKQSSVNIREGSGEAITTGQLNFHSSIKFYKPLSKRVTLFNRLQLATVASDIVYINDLYRIGGLKSFRGFNEKEFFTSKYAVATLEPRLFFGKESYVFTFADVGFTDNGIPPTSFRDTPIGLGAGISFATKTGVFSLAYAMGSNQNQSFGNKYAKIHFGLTSRF